MRNGVSYVLWLMNEMVKRDWDMPDGWSIDDWGDLVLIASIIIGLGAGMGALLARVPSG